MVRKLVISQSMLFPWVGLLEQIRLGDVFVHYDDVQFSKGSFVNRVQVKTHQGMKWMTVPLENLHLGQKIEDVQPKPGREWKQRHLDFLAQCLAGTPYAKDALDLVDRVYECEYRGMGALARQSMLALAEYFGLAAPDKFHDVKSLAVGGSGSQRVLAVAKSLGATTYITGHGAMAYLDHEAFERSGVTVEYMNYQCRPYPQMHGDFNPYVSALDLVANCGRDGARYICSTTIHWRDFKHVKN
jgi:hypothetical protein